MTGLRVEFFNARSERLTIDAEYCAVHSILHHNGDLCKLLKGTPGFVLRYRNGRQISSLTIFRKFNFHKIHPSTYSGVSFEYFSVSIVNGWKGKTPFANIVSSDDKAIQQRNLFTV